MGEAACAVEGLSGRQARHPLSLAVSAPYSFHGLAS